MVRGRSPPRLRRSWMRSKVAWASDAARPAGSHRPADSRAARTRGHDAGHQDPVGVAGAQGRPVKGSGPATVSRARTACSRKWGATEIGGVAADPRAKTRRSKATARPTRTLPRGSRINLCRGFRLVHLYPNHRLDLAQRRADCLPSVEPCTLRNSLSPPRQRMPWPAHAHRRI